MPFVSEHAARQSDPKGFAKFRRGHPKGTPSGVDFVFGVKSDGKTEIQSVRFDASKWTAAKAKAWLKARNFKAGDFEEAKKENGFTMDFAIQKVSEEKRIVGGWLYCCVDKNGNQVVDHSGEIIDIDDLENAAHGYLMDSRKGKLSHRGEPIADLVQLWVSRKSTRDQMGIPDGVLPDGVFVAYKVHETEAGEKVWQAVKSGELRMFSLGGGCRREAVQ